MSRSPIQVAESRLSTPTRALATTLRSQRRLPDHITSAFTSWTRRRAFTTCAPTCISRLQMMGIPVLRALLIKQVSHAKQNTNGSEYEMALYLNDWLLDRLEYDNSLKWSSAESALTRGLGTCQAYESAYSKLLTAAGITNSETRDIYDGHTWMPSSSTENGTRSTAPGTTHPTTSIATLTSATCTSVSPMISWQ